MHACCAEENHDRIVSKEEQDVQTFESRRIRSESARNPLRVSERTRVLGHLGSALGHLGGSLGHLGGALGHLGGALGHLGGGLGHLGNLRNLTCLCFYVGEVVWDIWASR